jgi:hypothetical protein
MEALSQAGGISIEKDIFTPDADGIEDFLTIRYRFGSPGYRASILVVDPRGRLVREIAVKALLGREGFYTWDGRNRNGAMAGEGIYLVLAEVADQQGRIRRYRLVCILSGS